MLGIRRYLPLAFAGILVGSCGGLPPGPTSRPAPIATDGPTSKPGSTNRPGSTSSVPASPADVGQPRVVLRSPSPTGVTWSVTEPGAPQRRSPLQVPFADIELGPASQDGLILATSGDRVLMLALEGSTLRAAASAPMPPGQTLLPACFGGDGGPIYADAESLTLVELTRATTRRFSDVEFTLGECAPLADGGTLVAVDGGGLVAEGDGGRSTPVVGVLGRHPSGGGGLVAMMDPSSELGMAVVRKATVSEDGVLGAVIGRVEGSGVARVVNAQLSPDGRWLAVVLALETDADPDAEPEGRLRLYRVGEDGLTRVADLALEVGARVTLLPGP